MTKVRTKETFRTLFAPRMHAVGSRVAAKTGTTLSVSTVIRGTMIYRALTMTSPPEVVLRLEAKMREQSSHSLVT
jgi:hypothetical protein